MKRFIKIFLIILLTLIVLFLSVCSKEQNTYSIINTEWEVLSITSPDRILFLKSPTPYHVNFHKDNIFNISLDVNSCGSSYRIEDENIIFIEPIYCTEVCCDKAFANTLLNVLKDVNSYKIISEDLTLFAPESIINLSKVNK